MRLFLFGLLIVALPLNVIGQRRSGTSIIEQMRTPPPQPLQQESLGEMAERSERLKARRLENEARQLELERLKRKAEAGRQSTLPSQVYALITAQNLATVCSSNGPVDQVACSQFINGV